MLVKSHGQYNRVIELVFFTTFMMTEKLFNHVIKIYSGLHTGGRRYYTRQHFKLPLFSSV